MFIGRRLFSCLAASVIGIVAEAQTSTPATPAIGSRAACTKSITIYIDLSGTMNKPEGAARKTPLNVIAATLRELLGTRDFLTISDTVTIKYFGSVVRTVSEERNPSIAQLERLAQASPEQVARETERQFNDFTDFEKLFDDVEQRLANAESKRQIIAIASDLAHDRLNQGCQTDNSAVRMSEFDAVLDKHPALAAALDPKGPLFGRVRVVAFRAPRGACVADPKVSDHAAERLTKLHIPIREYNDDPLEAARTLSAQLAGTITAKPVQEGYATINDEGKVAFSLTNMTCDPVTVTGLRFDRIQNVIDISPVHLDQESRTVTIDPSVVDSIWNSEATVEPVLDAKSSAHSGPSDPFWLGDMIKPRVVTPIVFSRPRSGQTLLLMTGEFRLHSGGELTVGGIESNNQVRKFRLPPMTARSLLLSFLTDAGAVKQLTSGTAPISISLAAEGPRVAIPEDEKPSATKTMTIARGQESAGGRWLNFILWEVLAIWLIVLVLGGTFVLWRRAGGRISDQVRWTKWLVPLFVVPAVAVYLVDRPLGDAPFHTDFMMLVAAGLRALLAAAAIGGLLRWLTVHVWRRWPEPRLKPHRVAVSIRQTIQFATYTLLVITVVLLGYTILYTPATSPPFLATIHSGVTP